MGNYLTLSMTFLVAVNVCASSGQENLRDLAKANGGRAIARMNVWWGGRSVTELVRLADVVVYATVTRVYPHLTDDGSFVVTDCGLDVRRVLKQRTPVNVSGQPGPTIPIIVRRLGGTVIEGGSEFVGSVGGYPNEVFNVGDDAVLLLVYNRASGSFECADGPFGAFKVSGRRVYPLTEEVSTRRGDVARPLADFLSRLENDVRTAT